MAKAMSFLLFLAGLVLFVLSLIGFSTYMFTERVTAVAHYGGNVAQGLHITTNTVESLNGPSLAMPIIFMVLAFVFWGGSWVVWASIVPKRPRPGLRSPRGMRRYR